MKIYYIDAEGMKLGRLVSVIKKTLQYTSQTANPYSRAPKWLVMVGNCSKLATSATKMKNKKYYFHSGCPGGLRTVTWKQTRLANPEQLIELAFRRMLSDTAHARVLLKKLRLHRTAFPYESGHRLIIGF